MRRRTSSGISNSGMANCSSSRDAAAGSIFCSVDADDSLPTTPLLSPSPSPGDDPDTDPVAARTGSGTADVTLTGASGQRHRLNLVSHNLWLIPFGAPLFLGRAERCAANLGAAAARLRQGAAAGEADAAGGADGAGDALNGGGPGSPLTVVCAQELWALRVGVFWPVLWGLDRCEAGLLRWGWVGGGRENPVYWLFKSLILLVVAVLTLVVQQWIPVLRWALWDPKDRAAAALKKRHGLPWSVSGVQAFRHHAPWRLFPMPVLMDSGLMLSASIKPDDWGFVPFDAAGNSEAVALKGVLWARFGALAVVTTHMTFVNNDGGGQRASQQRQLAAVVKGLLDSTSVGSVVLCGDFNHCLAEQTAAEFPNVGPGKGSPSVFRTAWLPRHASVDGLCSALGVGGSFGVTRLSTDAPTCEDGTVDHVFHIAPAAVAPVGRACRVVAMDSVPDDSCQFSDHCMVRATLDLSTAAPGQSQSQSQSPPFHITSV